jgi:hypothetical protein
MPGVCARHGTGLTGCQSPCLDGAAQGPGVTVRGRRQEVPAPRAGRRPGTGEAG